MKPNLKEVVLVSVDGINPNEALEALARCKDKCNFKSVYLLSFEEPKRPTIDYNFIKINKLTYQQNWSFIKSELAEQARLGGWKKVMICQHDAGILNADLWDDNWLEYDMIGAPWPERYITEWGTQVGNTGFCLLSYNLLQEMAKGPQVPHLPEDIQLAKFREYYEGKGLKFAPLEEAKKFAQELPIENHTFTSTNTFGFHKYIANIHYKSILK